MLCYIVVGNLHEDKVLKDNIYWTIEMIWNDVEREREIEIEKLL